MNNNHNTKISVLSQIPLGIWFIGITTTLMTISSTIIFILTPVFLEDVLGSSVQAIGTLDGIAEAVSQIVRLFSGPISDYFGKRKTLIVLGYGLTTLAKPIFAVATAVSLFGLARFIERIGNGLQAAPREALIGDLAPSHLKGTCFGLRNSLTKIGSVSGCLIAWYLMYTMDDYRFIFWIAIIPSIIGMFLLVSFVKDKETPKTENLTKPERHPIYIKDIIHLGNAFWGVMFVVAIFTLSHCSESFLSLRAKNLGLEVKHLPSIILVMNAVIVGIAYYAGSLSDRVGRKIFLFIGIATHVISLVILGFAPSWEWVMLGVVFWGIQMGTTEGVLFTIVVETTPKALRGTALGVFFLIRGISLFISSTMTGYLWDAYSPLHAFGICAIVGAISLIMLMFVHLPKIEENTLTN